jgi:uncharacterized protein
MTITGEKTMTEAQTVDKPTEKVKKAKKEKKSYPKRGFASIPLEKRVAIAKLGGRAVQASGKAHSFTSAEARIAGIKGAAARAAKRAAQKAAA